MNYGKRRERRKTTAHNSYKKKAGRKGTDLLKVVFMLWLTSFYFLFCAPHQRPKNAPLIISPL